MSSIINSTSRYINNIREKILESSLIWSLVIGHWALGKAKAVNSKQLTVNSKSISEF